MKIEPIKSNIKNEIYFDLYKKEINTFKNLYKQCGINANMLFFKIPKRQLSMVLNSVFKNSNNEVNNFEVTIIGLSSTLRYGIEYILEIKDISKNQIQLACLDVNIIGKGNKIKWEVQQ